MGHFHQHLNTFWQLFFLPKGGSRWTNDASSLGMATNGGLVLSSPGASSLIVGIRPSYKIKFSAVIATSGGGNTWSALPPILGVDLGLADAPDGQQLALVASSDGGELLARAASGQNWRTWLTTRSLGADSPSCGPTALTAVTFDADGVPLVAAQCGRRGVLGIFADRRGRWSRVGPALRGASRNEVGVLSLQSRDGGVEAIITVNASSGTRVVSAWSRSGTGGWITSPALVLGRSARVASAGGAGSAGEFVLSTAGSVDRLAVERAPGANWLQLPSPPLGTQTVASALAGQYDALAVDGSVMTDWRLVAPSRRWAKHQVVAVQILYGSSD